jgi:hypothetical protein
VSEGSLTPNVIRSFEYHAENYFLSAKGGVPEDQQVLHILGCFASEVVNDWIACNKPTLIKMNFTDFMTAFRKRWLPKDWEVEWSTKISGLRLDPTKEDFEAWSANIQKLNSALRGTTSHRDDNQLRALLENNVDDRLRFRAAQERTTQIKDLVSWLEKMREIDKNRHADRKHLREEVEEYIRTKRGSSSTRPSQQSSSQPPTTGGRSKTPSTSARSDRPPKLTEDERKLLEAHEGCFKCRRFFIGHRSPDCTVTLSGQGYKPLTVQDAERAAKAAGRPFRPAPVAAIIDADSSGGSESLIPVAACLPNELADESTDNSLSSVSTAPTLKCQHFLWKCMLKSPTDLLPVNALIDSGAHMVLIRPSLAKQLQAQPIPLPLPEHVSVAISAAKKSQNLTHYIELCPASVNDTFVSKPLHAVIAEGLCVPLILGLPFLVQNRITCNYANRQCLAPVGDSCINLLDNGPRRTLNTVVIDTLAAIHERAQNSTLDTLSAQEKEMRGRFKCVFEPLPHTQHLPVTPVARIRLKDPSLALKTRNYPCPRKWKDAWHTLLQQHLEAGRIRPSDAPAGSGAFIIPKADPTVLPRWVNDYRQLNTNTVTDSFPLPLISDILADCGQGKFFGSLDMTNSFFQTRMHPDDVKLTAVNTPWGLYEWTVMPMGIKNAPAIHQRRVTAALRPWIAKICHVYLDDIVIWSQSLEEHTENVTTILEALKENKLYCNPKKTKLFSTEIRFLGHRISARGIEVDEGKADRILDWPVPSSAKQMRSFLGLVRYLATFLPNLSKYTGRLDPLTRKECDKEFPPWTTQHQDAFDQIKRLATSAECLTTIDHNALHQNKIFVTTDASDFGSGAVLAFGPSYETARPVAYDSRTFKGAELNYPVHEKEQLAIIRALAKWRTDLLGHRFEIWTDHRTLQHLPTQKELSRRQARWMEFMSHYDATIHYIPGEKNNVADALSRLPDTGLSAVAAVIKATHKTNIHSRFQLEDTILNDIREGYKTDPLTAKLASAAPGMTNIRCDNDFWFVNDRLFIPKVQNVRETLFRLAHDKLGHFGGTKSYQALQDSFYWPRMRRDLELGYVPSCAECQRNKSKTQRPVGPLHPLPVPDSRCDSVAIDFIGPLPPDDGFDCILTLTDRLGSDIRIIPTTCSLTAQGLADIFFREWYCENGLPLEIVSDRDKLFVSNFWKALHELTGIKLKMSTSYHPETDGASERTNKTVIQCIRFAVERDQQGWAQALPKVRFDIMNTINKSTGYTPFQLRFGKSPRIIPPLSSTPSDDPASTTAKEHIARMLPIELDAKDNLLTAKIGQAAAANRNRNSNFPFRAGDRALLSTGHRRREYKSKDATRVAKFMPRYDGPYKIISTNPKHSTVTLDLPHAPRSFPVFHSSELLPFINNDDTLFPRRALHPPEPVIIDGEPEFFIDKIVEERRRRKQTEFRVRWQGEGPEGDKWLPASELEDCKALDIWQARKDKIRKTALR